MQTYYGFPGIVSSKGASASMACARESSRIIEILNHQLLSERCDATNVATLAGISTGKKRSHFEASMVSAPRAESQVPEDLRIRHHAVHRV
jgi:hypothetical protein